MLQAAREFLDAFEEGSRRRLLYGFEDAERFNWSYVPGARNGIPVKEMSETQREAALALLRSGLSAQGYQKSLDIMQLEGILREVEGRGPEDTRRDPEKYFFTLFGSLSGDGPWGWRIDGHHLSLNFSSLTGRIVGSTPAFMGANPAEVPHGPHKGWRILKTEEDMARSLLHALEHAQRKQAVIAAEAPSDILTRMSKEAQPGKPVGLPLGEMTDAQRAQAVKLVEEYLHRFQGDLAREHLDRVREAGIENLFFAWAGGTEPKQKHYYRIQGPRLLIEYDNTQNNANHVHSVVRDLESDFGFDALRRHYENSAQPGSGHHHD